MTRQRMPDEMKEAYPNSQPPGLFRAKGKQKGQTASLAKIEKRNETLALKNARLVHENMMMQNARLIQENMLLRMQAHSLASPLMAESDLMGEDQWWLQNGTNPWVMPPPGNFEMWPAQDGIAAEIDEDATYYGKSVGSSSKTSKREVPKSAQRPAAPPGLEVDEAPEAKEPGSKSQNIPLHLYTTVMLRNIPDDITRDVLLHIIDSEGFRGYYDFFYLPMDFKNMVGLGYCFVNLVDPEEAQRFRKHFEGFRKWGPAVSNDQACEVTWSNALQGRDAHVERYRNSPVMHESMPDEAKPMLFKLGERVTFPEPTKRIRAPKLNTQSKLAEDN